MTHDVNSANGGSAPIAILGAGVMGCSIAANAAAYEIPVVLVDVSESAIAAAERKIEAEFATAAIFGGGARYQNSAARRLINLSRRLQDIGSATFVIESVTEDFAIKQRVLRDAEEIVQPGVVMASNTSVISLARMGASLRRPERLMGIHFMNPVTLKRWVEVIRHSLNTQAVLDGAFQLLRRLEKRWTIVNDGPGFVSNRILMLMVNEAIGTVERGIADARGVDEIFRNCMSHKMGPLETADLIGLDTIKRSLEGLEEETGDPKFHPAGLLRKYVDRGKLGRKSGEGFYKYQAAQTNE